MQIVQLYREIKSIHLIHVPQANLLIIWYLILSILLYVLFFKNNFKLNEFCKHTLFSSNHILAIYV